MPEAVDSSSFDFYEGIRILVPGAAVVGTAEVALRAIGGPGAGLGLELVPGTLAALVVGLVLYFVDIPTRAAIFTPLQPTDVLDSWEVKPPSGSTTTNIYFVMLDSKIPPAIRARALYMGSMFRIGFELIFILALGAVVVLSAPLWSRKPSDDGVATDAAIWVGILAVICTWAIALNRDRAPYMRRGWTDLDQPPRLTSPVDYTVAAGSALLYTGLLCRGAPRWMLLVPIVAVLCLWAFRYLKGYRLPDRNGDGQGKKRSKRKRQPIMAAHACLLLGLGYLQVLLAWQVYGTRYGDSTTTWLCSWLGIMTVSLILVAARGHERRLRGAYSTQNTWLLLNRAEVVKDYFQPASTASDTEDKPEPAAVSETGGEDV